MVHSCCAYGCKNVFKKGTGLGFFRFPYLRNRRVQWTLAIRRKNFIPSNSSRICGAHFQTGRPSRDANHPDYVPNIFVYNSGFKGKNRKRQTKRRHKKELLEDVRELPFLNPKMEDQEPSSNTSSDSESSNEYPKFEEEFLPEFDAEVEKSSFITKNTVKYILANDALNNPNTVPDKFAIYGKNRFPPKKFTFLDENGKLLAKFTERRLRKNTPFKKRRHHHPIFSSHTVKQTVQVIVDKKNAKTAYVDIDSITDYTKGLHKIKKELDEDYSEVNYPDIYPYLNAVSANGFPEIKEEIDDEDDSSIINNYDSTTFPDTDYADDFCGNKNEIGNEYYSNIRNNSDNDMFPDTVQFPHAIRISSVFESTPQNDDKADADLFSWYSELRTLNNRNTT